MSIFIRLEATFWQHRKTIRLRGMIGDAALWIPPRLWSYASQNQPDGDFSQYTADDLAMLLGYSGDATSMLQALQKTCFMDEMKVHGWEERNSYHATFAERAKKAASARWQKERSKENKENTGEEREREPSIASPMLVASTIPLAEIPSELEFIKECARYLVPEDFARDKFLKQDGEGWEKVRNWRSIAKRTKGWFEGERHKSGSNGNGSKKPYSPNI